MELCRVVRHAHPWATRV